MVRLPPPGIAITALARSPGAVLTREQLLEAVARRPDEVYERVVDVHVANLRRKLGDDAGTPWLIETVPQVGYRSNYTEGGYTNAVVMKQARSTAAVGSTLGATRASRNL